MKISKGFRKQFTKDELKKSDEELTNLMKTISKLTFEEFINKYFRIYDEKNNS